MTGADEFEKQWGAHARLRACAGKLAIYDAAPAVMKDSLPVVLCAGWMERPRMIRPRARALFARSRRVLTLDTARSGGMSVPPYLRKFQSRFGQVELRKACALLALLEEKHIPRADLIAHSEGALFALAAALARPEKFRTLILVNPAGLVGEDGAFALTARFLRELSMRGRSLALAAEGKEPVNLAALRLGAADILGAVGTFLAHPLGALASVRSIARADLRGLVREARGKGLRVGIVHSTADQIFPDPRMHDALAGEVDEFIEPKGSHVWYMVEPERYGDLMDEILTAAADAMV